MQRSALLKKLCLCVIVGGLGSLAIATAAEAAPVRVVNHPDGLGTGLAVDGDVVYWTVSSGGLHKTTISTGKTERIVEKGVVTRVLARAGHIAYVIKQSNPSARRNTYRLYKSDDRGKNTYRVASAIERDFSNLGVGRICGKLISLKSISESGQLLYAVQTDKTRGQNCRGKHTYTTRIFSRDPGIDPTIPGVSVARYRTGALVLAVAWPWVMQVGSPGTKSLRFTSLSPRATSVSPVRMTKRRIDSAMSSSFDQAGNALISVAALGSGNPVLRDTYLHPILDTNGVARLYGDPLKLASKSPKRFQACGNSLISWTDEFAAGGKYALDVVRNPFNPLSLPARPVLPNTSRRVRHVACDIGSVVFQLAGATANSKATDLYVNSL